MIKTRSFLSGFLFGGFLAGSAVLLSTPKSGKEIREQTRHGVSQARNTWHELSAETVTLKNDLLTAARNSLPAIKEGTKEIKQSIANWRKDTESDLERLQKRIRELNEQMDQLESTVKKDPSS
ncbi:MAG TPA: YtxH domain-containing protein [Bacillales bacterium]|nr:YtxH domain-containing protein [Bacillales bacterium]